MRTPHLSQLQRMWPAAVQYRRVLHCNTTNADERYPEASMTLSVTPPSSLQRRLVGASQQHAAVYWCYVAAPKRLCSVAGAASHGDVLYYNMTGGFAPLIGARRDWPVTLMAESSRDQREVRG